jgi:hypothetical protein
VGAGVSQRTSFFAGRLKLLADRQSLKKALVEQSCQIDILVQMTRRHALLAIVSLASLWQARAAISLSADGYHVYPGDEIQTALDLAGSNNTNKTVRVHAGHYRPESKRQALIWFNRRHDGVKLLAEGAVTLAAANPELSLPSDPGYPAAVNHVVYFGDAISTNTVLDGFRITGANSFLCREKTRQMEPDASIPKNLFFFSDGGAIKIFGRSYPVLRNIQVVDNFTSPCGGGISIQHQGYNESAVLIENCVFLRNRAQATGAAVDLLAGSAARIVNCLFVGNISNLGEDPVAKNSGEVPFVNNGVVTIFQKSRAEVRNCTFTGNRNGVDDMGGQSSYLNCIFFDNNLEGALKRGARYELAVNGGAKQVVGCFFSGAVHDVAHAIPTERNTGQAPSPQFDKSFVPHAPGFETAGYRPISDRSARP